MRLAVFVLVALLRACLCETQVASVLELGGYVTVKHILPECPKSCQASVTYLSGPCSTGSHCRQKHLLLLRYCICIATGDLLLIAKHTKQIECLNQVFYAFRTLFANSCTLKTSCQISYPQHCKAVGKLDKSP